MRFGWLARTAFFLVALLVRDIFAMGSQLQCTELGQILFSGSSYPYRGQLIPEAYVRTRPQQGLALHNLDISVTHSISLSNANGRFVD
jgi:hypothetical protein